MTGKVADLQSVIPGNAQHIGLRSEQQDSFGFSSFDEEKFVSHAGILAVVADGMGGLAMGKDSSVAAVQTFLSTYAAKEAEETIAALLDRSLHAANRAVNRKAAEGGVEGEAGTTLVAAVIHEKHLYRVSAGDSRIYLFRGGTLRQLTTDYNYGRVLERMVEKGEIGKAEAAAHPSRAALTSYLGKAELDEYDHPSDPPLELKAGDKILLASDGLFGFLPEVDIVRLMDKDPQQAAEALVNETIARKMPYQDNVTVAILGYALPPPVPLSDTVLRKEPPLQQELPPLKTGEPVRAKSSAAKWGVIVLLLLVLAIAGFFGGQYFGGDL